MTRPRRRDFAAQRLRMVSSQLRPRGIADARVLAAMAAVPRELFVEEGQQRRAYSDNAMPIGEGQTISQPWIVAFMAQELELSGHERVLEIGAGSGYGAAVLGRLAAEVWSVERIPALARRSAAVLRELGAANVHVLCGDGSQGLPEHAPYGGISVTAAAPEEPAKLLDQLAPEGRLVCPVREDGADRLTRYRRRGGGFEREPLVPCRFVPLVEGGGYAAARPRSG